MKISHYIFLGFVFILFLFAATTWINFRLSEAVTENADFLSRSSGIIKNSGRFQRNILTMVNGLRGYLLTGERSFIESYDAANGENDSILAELSLLLTDSAQSRLLRDIRRLNDHWTEAYTEPLRQAKMMSAVSPKHLDEFNRFYREKFAAGEEKQIQTRLQDQFRAFTTLEYGTREVRKAQLIRSIRNTRNLSILFTVLSVIIAFLIIGLLVRKISRRLGQMTAMANTIAAGKYDVSIPDTDNDELSSLGHSLNHMAGELSRTISLLQRSNAELDQFAHIVSHDMKGPLRGIGNVVSWMEEDHLQELSPKVQEYLGLIKGRIHRAEHLIEGLLAYASTDKEAVEVETVDLNELMAEVLEHLPRGGHVRVETAPLPVIRSERLLLFQVFSNLISNAIKYNDKEEGLVRIYWREDPGGYEFFVADNGVGIAEVYHQRIFTIFQTLQDRDSYESTGVGLAIVKKILDSKGQRIQLTSVPGEGTTFSFTWPKSDENETD